MTTRRKPWTRRPFCKALIEESDLATCLHAIFQNQHIAPGVVMGLRAPNDPIPEGERAFIMASTKKALLEGDTPIKLKNLTSKKSDKGGNA